MRPHTFNRHLESLPLLLPAVALFALAIAIFALNPAQPLLESHSYRQTQTAITSFWMLRGGDFFDYLTPILGYPWTVPMELPLFQALVAMVAGSTGMPLDFTGRLVSYVFFLLTCIPIALTLRRYGWHAVVAAFAIFLTSPVNLFYARAFLMETAATLAALAMLCAYLGYRRSGRSMYLAVMAVFGALAGLQKVTTFLPVFAVCCVDALLLALPALREGRWRAIEWRLAGALAAALVLPAWWAIHADQIKSGAPLSALLMSHNLSDWNFGTLEQRISPDTWSRIFYDRFFLYGGLSVAVLMVAVAAYRKSALFNAEALLFMGAGLLGPLIFWNLHFVHDYYQLSSIVFLACAAAIMMSPWLETVRRGSSIGFVGAVVLIFGANIWLFQQRYWPYLFVGPNTTAYAIGRYINGGQSPEEVSVIIGQRFSSTIPYYAERFAVMMPETPVPPPELRAAVINDPHAFTGGREIGSVVYCTLRGKSLLQQKQEKETLFAVLEGDIQRVGNCEVKVRRRPAATIARGP